MPCTFFKKRIPLPFRTEYTVNKKVHFISQNELATSLLLFNAIDANDMHHDTQKKLLKQLTLYF